MKKIFTFGVISSMLVAGLASCDKTGKDEMVINFDALTYNLITPLDGSEDYSVYQNVYSLKIEAHNSTVEIASPTMLMPNGGKLNFELPALKYTLYQGIIDQRYAAAYKFDTNAAGENNSQVKNLAAYFTQACYLPSDVNYLDMKVTVPNVASSMSGFPGYPLYFVANYELNDQWLVRTFWPDQSFRGTSVINNAGAIFENKDILYRIVMKIDATGVIGKKADVVLYNAKFDEDPDVVAVPAILLKDLNLTFSSKGWQISGSNITGNTVQDGTLAPNADYMFDSFEASATGDLVSMNCNLLLNGKFSTTFTGDYMIKVTNNPQ